MFGRSRDRTVTHISVVTHLSAQDPRDRSFSIKFGDGRRGVDIEFSEESITSLRDAINASLEEAAKIQ